MTKDGLAQRSFSCVTCGYDLRGTALGGNCPECGTPVAASIPVRDDAYRLDGDRLVIRDGANLPPYCVKTGLPAEETDGKVVTKKLTWVPGAVYLLLLINLLILLIVYLVVKKECRVTYFVSAEVIRRSWMKQLVGLAVFLMGLGSCVVTGFLLDGASRVSDEVLITLGVLTGVLILGGLVVIGMSHSHVSIRKHEDGRFWLGGLSPEFVARVRADEQAEAQGLSGGWSSGG